ncbi:hypothetical protein BU14_0014s0120 [Porphyra umbilicalis]|uniref:Ribosomal protein S13 n=1 Tax=Porphyra umbilicalis TaxID=2786 RepID=A0A1X6PL86_PORUM|nr:hypothetical protein BU14_0014s0120 [Porphyra umbilicalis]|eukprot:OSX81572.1 hypothetical protein BU14_0014s0120 [Porphyra umbilicalis]
MALRFLGVALPPNEPLWRALQRVYGIGRSTAVDLTHAIGGAPSLRVRELAPSHVAALYAAVEAGDPVQDARRVAERAAVDRLVRIGCYRGGRHTAQLPTRGQRTHTNAHTQKKMKRA